MRGRQRTVEDGKLYCARGNHMAPLNKFYEKKGARYKDGARQSWCMDCFNAWRREKRATQRGEVVSETDE